MAKRAKAIPAGSPVEDLRQPAPAAAPAAVSAEGSSGEGPVGGEGKPPTNAGAVASAPDFIPEIPPESAAQGGSGDPAAPAGLAEAAAAGGDGGLAAPAFDEMMGHLAFKREETFSDIPPIIHFNADHVADEWVAKYPRLFAASEAWKAAHPDTRPSVIRISAKVEGFRRAGMAHSKAPVDHPLGTFDPDQLEQLLGEPNLKVEFA